MDEREKRSQEWVASLPPGLNHVSDWMMKIKLHPTEQDGKIVFKHVPVSMNEAEANTAALLNEHYERYQAGDEKAVLDLLAISKDFIDCPWVKDAIAGWYKSGNHKMLRIFSGNPRRGPKNDNTKWAFYFIVLSLESKEMSREKAFGELEGRTIFGKALSYYAIKRDFYICEGKRKERAIVFDYPPGTLCRNLGPK